RTAGSSHDPERSHAAPCVTVVAKPPAHRRGFRGVNGVLAGDAPANVEVMVLSQRPIGVSVPLCPSKGPGASEGIVFHYDV
ncbi:hypothetical protein, partial [Microbacterium sp. K41]|uniref:hypothetical protein n=1 Tax=Microbacterium sp. K41 TaxID=2305437 RepID=UPI00197B2285